MSFYFGGDDKRRLTRAILPNATARHLRWG